MRFLFAVVLALGIAAAAYGAAATLQVQGGAAQAGSASANCDADGVTVSYNLDNSGNVDSVTIGDIECLGADVIVDVAGTSSAANNNLDGSFADVSSSSVTCGSGSPNFDANVNVADITSVAVTLISSNVATNNCS